MKYCVEQHSWLCIGHTQVYFSNLLSPYLFALIPCSLSSLEKGYEDNVLAVMTRMSEVLCVSALEEQELKKINIPGRERCGFSHEICFTLCAIWVSLQLIICD